MYRVIIVDDEPIIRKGLRETIEWDSLGLEVAGEAANGVEALRLVRSIRPEILITDIRMPEMDGLALIQECSGKPCAIMESNLRCTFSPTDLTA